MFLLKQARRSAFAELRLAGSFSLAKCGGSGQRPHRRLTADTQGRFVTAGRFSTANAKNASWTVEDSCKGTLTRVTRGRATVHDPGHHRTKTVKAGHSYLARRGNR